ncbi:MAG: VWA domain-containing protein [Candidatus Scalinduaceae bacterium]
MGFINLIALGYLSLISLVVLIYFFNKKKNVIEVPSIIPWEILKEDIVRSRLFKIDLLFLLQILLILLLIFFLARPYLNSSIINISGKNYILIIDSSASMQTSEANGSRFDQAKSQTLKMVSKLNQWDKMMIISANSSARVITEFTNDKHKLNKVISNLKPKDTGTNLGESVSLGISFLKNVERGEMYVLTDQSPSSISFIKQEGKNINFVRYGKNYDNVAITSLDVYQDMFKDYTEREAYITIRNFSDSNKNVILNVFLNNKTIEEKEVELKGGGQKTISVKNISSSGILKAEIKANDFLSVDNTAYAIINKIKAIDILLVSNNNKLNSELDKIQHNTHRIKLTQIEASDYTREDVKNYDVVIFHKFIPDFNPGINSLYIFPTKGTAYSQKKNFEEDEKFNNLIFVNQRLVKNAKILDWDRTHPTMRHLDNLDEINIMNAIKMDPPSWSTPLIKIAGDLNDSPIAFAGRYAGKRLIVLGLDLSEFDFSKSDNLQVLIMTLNLIQWLNPYEIEGNSKILTGRQYIPNYALKSNIEILNPKAETFKYNFKDNTEEHFVFNKIEYIGEYKITGANFESVFVANLFDEKESNIRPKSIDNKELNFEEKEVVKSKENKRNEFGKYLLLLVPFILLLEWLLYYRKVRAGTA